MSEANGLAGVGQQIESLTAASLKPQVLYDTGGERAEVIGGEVVVTEIPREPRRHVIRDLDEFVKFSERFKAEVFYSEFAAEALLDPASHDQATLDIDHHPQWAQIRGLLGGGSRGYTPREAVKVLKQQWGSAGALKVAEALSVVDFERLRGSKHSTRHGQDTMGRSVEARVQNVESIPESFEVVTAVSCLRQLAEFRVTVEIGVYIDTEAETVSFFIVPGSFEQARRAFENALSDALRAADEEGGVQFYRGTL